MIENVVIVLDQSGSMDSIKEATIDGFNEFLQEQDMEDGDTYVTLVQFNHEIDVVYEDRPVEDAAELTDENFDPAGRTAYYDALAQAIHEGPDDETLFFVITDGMENASTDTSQEDIQELVQEAKSEGHEILLMDGSGRNEELTADELGIDTGKTLSNDASKGGTTRSAYTSSSNVSKSLRSGEDASYDEDDRQQAAS